MHFPNGSVISSFDRSNRQTDLCVVEFVIQMADETLGFTEDEAGKAMLIFDAVSVCAAS